MAVEFDKAMELVRLEAQKQRRLACLSETEGDGVRHEAYASMADALETVLQTIGINGRADARIILLNSLPGLNDYITAERTNRHLGAKMKREAQQIVELCARSQLRKFRPTGSVWMKYTWYERNRRRDKDNISSFGRKVIQDGLVKTHVLQNDGWEQIEGFSDEFRVDAKRPRVEVEISEAAP